MRGLDGNPPRPVALNRLFPAALVTAQRSSIKSLTSTKVFGRLANPLEGSTLRLMFVVPDAPKRELAVMLLRVSSNGSFTFSTANPNSPWAEMFMLPPFPAKALAIISELRVPVINRASRSMLPPLPPAWAVPASVEIKL